MAFKLIIPCEEKLLNNQSQLDPISASFSALPFRGINYRIVPSLYLSLADNSRSDNKGWMGGAPIVLRLENSLSPAQGRRKRTPVTS